MPNCLNLRSRYGDRYVIKFEESRQGRERDRWLMVIPCKLGHVFPFGGTKLAASVDGHPKLARKIAALPGCRVHQDGSDGMTIVFDAEHFDAVAKIMRPKRRRSNFQVHNRLGAGVPAARTRSKQAA